MLDLLEEQRHLQLFVGLLPGLMDLLAAGPAQVDAGEGRDPLEEGVVNVPEEVEVMLPNFKAVTIVVKRSLCHHQLISVAVEVFHKDG